MRPLWLRRLVYYSSQQLVCRPPFARKSEQRTRRRAIWHNLPHCSISDIAVPNRGGPELQQGGATDASRLPHAALGRLLHHARRPREIINVTSGAQQQTVIPEGNKSCPRLRLPTGMFLTAAEKQVKHCRLKRQAQSSRLMQLHLGMAVAIENR